jgi:ubiquinone/menaquinone biosynthesis C-methylase UbiE
MTTSAIYDKIGITYDSTRRADAQIVSRLIELLSPRKNGSYLDVGCGSGNYTQAIFRRGFKVTGLDISEEMLSKARIKNNQIVWITGDAKSMSFESRYFDGAICILATHHIKDIDRAFQEVYRVLKRGNFVIFTAFPEQMNTYWLHHYFPRMMQKAQQAMVSSEIMIRALSSAGFREIRIEKFFVTNALDDWFLHAGKYRPEIYLNPQVRAGISTFALEENQDEVELGCQKLQTDISSGEINKIIASYESNLGDYAFVACNTF